MTLRATTARALIRWPTQQAVDLAGSFHVFRSPRNSPVVDYETPINPAPIPAWPPHLRHAKVGFGLDGFGEGPFGIGEGGFGFGVGAFGLGGFGEGAELLEYLDVPLEDGTYTYAVVPADAAGNRDETDAPEDDVDLAGRPWPPTAAEAAAYDDETETLTLDWTPDPRNVTE